MSAFHEAYTSRKACNDANPRAPVRSRVHRMDLPAPLNVAWRGLLPSPSTARILLSMEPQNRLCVPQDACQHAAHSTAA